MSAYISIRAHGLILAVQECNVAVDPSLVQNRIIKVHYDIRIYVGHRTIGPHETKQKTIQNIGGARHTYDYVTREVR